MRDIYIKGFKQIYCDDKNFEGVYGLGQICKKINEMEYGFVDFLSRDFIFYGDNEWYITRSAMKIMQGGMLTNKHNFLNRSVDGFTSEYNTSILL